MSSAIRILVPFYPQNAKPVYFKGHVTISEKYAITIYITKYSSNEDIFLENKTKDNILYGIYRGNLIQNKSHKYYNLLVLKQRSDLKSLKVHRLLVNGVEINTSDNCIVMFYDYESIRASQTITDTSDYFYKLHNFIQSEYSKSTSKLNCDTNIESPKWLSSSMFLQHIFNYWKLIYWFLSCVKKHRKISVKHGNLILAIIMDIILGYFVLQLFSQDRQDISSLLMGALEKLINLLYTLLTWLMGAPVGLKLNNAFNKMLGKYFSYHVQLWWLFLDVTGEKLDMILHIYHYVGYLGFTFQTAMVADLICLATFHSYCIYVYAARLFNIQISGIIALFRLFVGRKYNPLRGGIDSCEYTNQELFVGTVAFTILLLLLPTTALYYIVFTLIRILSIAVQYFLAKLIYIVQTLPLYVVSLWIVKSPKVAGNIQIEVLNNEENSPLILRARLFSKSIRELVKAFQPPVEVPKQMEWTSLLSNVLVGKQLV